MASIKNQGIRIHYQVVGDGPPLILQHGFSGSLQLWYGMGYVERLSNDYRLILVDARGHGGSDKPHEPEAYKLDQFAKDITAVLDDLHIERAHFWGYSMGGWIGFGVASYAAHRLESLIIGGAQPYGRSFAQARDLLQNGIDGWIRILADEGDFSKEALEQTRSNDVQALLALLQDRSDISEILPDVEIPCLLYAGSEDSQFKLIEKCAQDLPMASLIAIPNQNHLQVMTRSDLVVPHVMRFLDSV